MYASLATVASGPVLIDYRVVTSIQRWIAGNYQAELEFHTGGLAPNQIIPVTQKLNIQVPAFITPASTLGTITMAVNDLSFFRSAAGISTSNTFNVASTVPYVPALASGANNFSFTTAAPYAQLPVTATNSVNTVLTGLSNAVSVPLASTPQNLISTGNVAVPAANNQMLTATFSITGANLRQSFVQAGTYSVPITFTYSKPTDIYPSGPLQSTRSGTLQVVVSDLSEITANQTSVGLAFNTAEAWRQGLTTQMASHIRLSRTTPYSVYVRATSASFSSGSNTIPVSVMRIGPGTNQTGMNTVTLSTTPQLLIANAAPETDRSLNIAYSIPAANTPQLLNKPSGNYSAAVIYSFTAL